MAYTVDSFVDLAHQCFSLEEVLYQVKKCQPTLNLDFCPSVKTVSTRLKEWFGIMNLCCHHGVRAVKRWEIRHVEVNVSL